jgi:excisionase family DNA binding protein
MKVIEDLHRGKAVVLMPEEETFTTQAAANFLGMSRQFFVTLLESGQIPFHRVGSHRRVYFKDLRDYSRKRDGERRTGMKQLFDEVKQAGLYDASYTGEE